MAIRYILVQENLMAKKHIIKEQVSYVCLIVLHNIVIVLGTKAVIAEALLIIILFLVVIKFLIKLLVHLVMIL